MTKFFKNFGNNILPKACMINGEIWAISEEILQKMFEKTEVLSKKHKAKFMENVKKTYLKFELKFSRRFREIFKKCWGKALGRFHVKKNSFFHRSLKTGQSCYRFRKLRLPNYIFLYYFDSETIRRNLE